MSTTNIVNGAGMVIEYGTDDLSTVQVPVQREQVPQHLPLLCLFTQKQKGKYLVDSSSRARIFGSQTFDPRSVYFNHATLFANECNAQGNKQMIIGLTPDDAGPKSNKIIWLDVLPTEVDLYERNEDGSIRLNTITGEPTVVGVAAGFKVKFVATTQASRDTQDATWGTATQSQGDQTDGSGVHSTRYPIMQLENDYFGGDGNNTGFRLWAPTTAGGNVMPSKMMSEYQAYPYYFSVLERTGPTATPSAMSTILGEKRVMFTFKSGVQNPTTTQQISWDKNLVQSYDSSDDPAYPPIYGRIGKIFVYETVINQLLAMFHAAEVPYIGSDSDITVSADSAGLFNFISGVDSSNVPYQTYVFVDQTNSFRFTEYTNVFLASGSDGTLSNEVFEDLVTRELAKYADPEDQVQDIAYNVESWFYDSGFSLETKFAIPQFISQRKDTLVALGTHAVGEVAMTESEEHSVAVALRTRLQMYPESEYFGTPVMRAIIMGRSGIVRNNEYDKRVPATFELMSKFAAYMGASNGQWTKGASPEGDPGNVVTRLKDINIQWISNSARNRAWDIGLNWILRKDRQTYFIPHYKTVYSDDTSVLNSILTAAAIAELNKVAHACWRFYVGRSDLTAAQLTDRCNAFVTNNTRNRFDNRFTIIPAATITDMDALRGYSWTLPIKLGANNMRTVMTTWVEAYRKADLDALGDSASTTTA